MISSRRRGRSPTPACYRYRLNANRPVPECERMFMPWLRTGNNRLRLGGGGGWAVAVVDAGSVGAGHGGGAVGVERGGPAPLVDGDEVVEGAVRGRVRRAGRWRWPGSGRGPCRGPGSWCWYRRRGGASRGC